MNRFIVDARRDLPHPRPTSALVVGAGHAFPRGLFSQLAPHMVAVVNRAVTHGIDRVIWRERCSDNGSHSYRQIE